jgi:hypothetical protein
MAVGPLRNDPNGVAQAFAEFGRGRNGLLLDNSNPIQLKADQICGLASQRGIPAVGRERTFADAGCLMSYAENPNEMYRRAAGLVDRILKGAKPHGFCTCTLCLAARGDGPFSCEGLCRVGAHGTIGFSENDRPGLEGLLHEACQRAHRGIGDLPGAGFARRRAIGTARRAMDLVDVQP